MWGHLLEFHPQPFHFHRTHVCLEGYHWQIISLSPTHGEVGFCLSLWQDLGHSHLTRHTAVGHESAHIREGDGNRVWYPITWPTSNTAAVKSLAWLCRTETDFAVSHCPQKEKNIHYFYCQHFNYKIIIMHIVSLCTNHNVNKTSMHAVNKTWTNIIVFKQYLHAT